MYDGGQTETHPANVSMYGGNAPEKIIFGMGCFWKPDALFGSLPGVVRTRTGFAGGTKPDPDYREMGDHTECVEVHYDPGVVTVEELLNVFWNGHNPVGVQDYKGRQYVSMLLYTNEVQRAAADKTMLEQEERRQEAIGTEIRHLDVFYEAEERHQKYYLKRFPDAAAKVSVLYPTPRELTDSTLAARLNGMAKGFGSRQSLLDDMRGWQIREEERGTLEGLVKSVKW